MQEPAKFRFTVRAQGSNFYRSPPILNILWIFLFPQQLFWWACDYISLWLSTNISLIISNIELYSYAYYPFMYLWRNGYSHTLITSFLSCLILSFVLYLLRTVPLVTTEESIPMVLTENPTLFLPLVCLAVAITTVTYVTLRLEYVWYVWNGCLS